MKKKLLSMFLVLGVVTTLFAGSGVTTFAATTDAEVVAAVNEMEASVSYDGFEIKVVDSIPENVIPKSFNTWEEATDWVNALGNEFESRQRSMYRGAGELNDGFEYTGDVGWVSYSSMPSGTGSTKKYNSYDVPGLTAQTVDATHYFEYSNKKVTKCTGSAKIGGLGLATFKTTYAELEKYGNGSVYNYYSVVKGDLGYYISVGGVNVGIYEDLELTYCLYNFYN